MPVDSSFTRRAVIDVGTNSVKLLVAEVGGGAVSPLLEQSEQTRLGRGFYETCRLQPGPLALTAQAVARFAAEAQHHGATSIRVIATSAARDAANAGELVRAIEQAAGLRLEIISGEQEAGWSFQGVTSNPEFAAAPLLILDVGGGSTEFILGAGGRAQFRRSFPLGSVRLLEQFHPGDPPAAAELAACRAHLQQFFAQEILPQLAAFMGGPGFTPAQTGAPGHGSGAPDSDPAGGGKGLARADAEIGAPPRLPGRRQCPDAPAQTRILVGTGGTSTILARMKLQTNVFNRAAIEQQRFRREEIRRETGRLWRLPLAARQQITGLPPNRADVILFGAAIYEAVMSELGFDELRVSTRGLRFGAVLEGD
ncbi:MAG: hypothetical protein HZA89_01670 [Verrucomicrobia bacterium]|nr:hypothetical protein [Verrucomicrobiota bacterium]